MSDPNKKEEKAKKQAERQERYKTALLDYGKHGIEFIPFPKIPRLNRNITITEKIDGTNGAIHIAERSVAAYDAGMYTEDDLGRVVAQSRSRLLTTKEDNYGFARWVEENAQALREVLGPGTHFGEWWGQGIQRGYGQTRKWFSLFNYNRWANDPSVMQLAGIGLQVVPILYHGPWMAVVGGPANEDVYPRVKEDGSVVPGILRYAPDVVLDNLAKRGSVAAMVNATRYVRTVENGRVTAAGPEGIVVFHEAGRLLFKATIENDEQPKSLEERMQENMIREIESEGIDE